MKLLLSNDDGIFALGLRTLANHLAEAGHQVTVVCPDRERSATGHGLTIHKPLRAELVESVFDPAVKAWSCSGTPSDCIKLGLGAILEHPPDFVLSGINHGPNLGTDVLYSGTVSAAMEGVIEGISSMAFSLASFSNQGFKPAAEFAQALLTQLGQLPLPEVMLLNINVPALAPEEIAGVMVTRQGVRRYYDIFEKRLDPRGKTYYWLAGEVLEEIEQPLDPDSSTPLLTDVQAIKKNYITVTPLKYNLTYTPGLKTMATWSNKITAETFPWVTQQTSQANP